jgi:hypothetical protein
MSSFTAAFRRSSATESSFAKAASESKLRLMESRTSPASLSARKA